MHCHFLEQTIIDIFPIDMDSLTEKKVKLRKQSFTKKAMLFLNLNLLSPYHFSHFLGLQSEKISIFLDYNPKLLYFC